MGLISSMQWVSPLHSASLTKKMNSIPTPCAPESSLLGKVVNVANDPPSS